MIRSSIPILSRWAKPMLGYTVMVAAIALLGSALVRTPSVAHAQDAAADGQNVVQAPATVFPANAGTLGAIPDSPAGGTTCGDFTAAPRDVTFTVSGLTGSITDVRVNMTVNHTWAGDLDVRLLGPGGAPSGVVFAQTGEVTSPTGCGDNSDLAGPYNFYDTAPAAPTWWAAATTAGATTAIAAGDYRVSTVGGGAGGGANALLTPTFNATSPNGTWTLRIRDGGSGDTGSITAANLTINTTTSAGCTTAKRPLDLDGDGKTDYNVVRNTGGGPSGQITWFTLLNGGGTAPFQGWGIASDQFVPNDYDGDGKTDIAVWRPSATPGATAFFILQSSNGAFRAVPFGQIGDQPDVVGDYDGDGKSDPAVYRPGAASGDQSVWYYLSSLTGSLGASVWGQNGDFPAPGDYDGDNKFDYVVQRNAGGGSAIFFILRSSGGSESAVFGFPTDVIVPGYYDNDCKTDIATVRGSGGQILWAYRSSVNGSVVTNLWGQSATDFPVMGDYNGDGTTDLAVWRPSATPGQSSFFVMPNTGVPIFLAWGQNGDYPTANYNTH